MCVEHFGNFKLIIRGILNDCLGWCLAIAASVVVQPCHITNQAYGYTAFANRSVNPSSTSNYSLLSVPVVQIFARVRRILQVITLSVTHHVNYYTRDYRLPSRYPIPSESDLSPIQTVAKPRPPQLTPLHRRARRKTQPCRSNLPPYHPLLINLLPRRHTPTRRNCIHYSQHPPHVRIHTPKLPSPDFKIHLRRRRYPQSLLRLPQRLSRAIRTVRSIAAGCARYPAYGVCGAVRGVRTELPCQSR